MTFNRGEVWLANLNPIQGSEQGGTRPVIVFQNNIISKFSTTIITIPLTTNLRRAKLPSSLLIASGQGGLGKDSVEISSDEGNFARRKFTFIATYCFWSGWFGKRFSCIMPST